MGIDPSALGDGRGQRMLIRSLHGKCVAWKPGQPLQAGLPINADWTGQMICPPEKFWWGELDLHSPLARLVCPCSRRSGHAAGMEPWGSTSRNGFTIDRIM